MKAACFRPLTLPFFCPFRFCNNSVGKYPKIFQLSLTQKERRPAKQQRPTLMPSILSTAYVWLKSRTAVHINKTSKLSYKSFRGSLIPTKHPHWCIPRFACILSWQFASCLTCFSSCCVVSALSVRDEFFVRLRSCIRLTA